jgi:hypothetical protein
LAIVVEQEMRVAAPLATAAEQSALLAIAVEQEMRQAVAYSALLATVTA